MKLIIESVLMGLLIGVPLGAFPEVRRNHPRPWPYLANLLLLWASITLMVDFADDGAYSPAVAYGILALSMIYQVNRMLAVTEKNLRTKLDARNKEYDDSCAEVS